MTDDILAQLLECSFNGISFPIGPMSADLSHALAVHGRVDWDGARIESTGLNPEEFHLQAILVNGIAPGINEFWDALFPQTFLKLKDAFRSRETGILNHPIYGEQRVKASHWHEEIRPEMRSGVIVDLVFVATRETDDEAESLASTSPLAIAAQAAADLIAQIDQFHPPLPSVPEKPNLLDAVSAITSVAGQISLATDQIAGMPGKIISKCNKVIDAVDTLSKSPDKVRRAAANAGAHAVDSANRLKDAMQRIKDEASAPFAETEYYTTQKPMTLSSLARILKSKPEDLIKFNPFLAAAPVIPIATVIRYLPAKKRG